MAPEATSFEAGNESALLAEVSRFNEFPSLESLTTPALRSLSVRRGIEFATALLYDRARRSPRHAAFIAAVDRLHEDRTRVDPGPPATVAIVPAAFYREKPHSGADGRLVYEEALQLGFRCERIPLSSTGTLAENSKVLLEWLAARADEPLILVSVCKGGADVKFALSRPDAGSAFRGVRTWINICGTLSGSPVAHWLLAQKLRFLGAWLFCKCKGHDFRFLRELVPADGGPLSHPLELPASVQLITLIGFPLKKHLSNRFMRQCHGRIAPQGPNDGGALLADACGLPGLLYPVWGADHYLRPEDRGRRLIAAVLKYSAPLRAAGEIPRAGEKDVDLQACGTRVG